MNKFALILIVVALGIMACLRKESNTAPLNMTSDQVVKAMVELYTVNAALGITDIDFRDSTAGLYYEQLAKITGHSVSSIKDDFNKLLLMPDTLLSLQNQALDTLRVLQEKGIYRPTVNIGIN